MFGLLETPWKVLRIILTLCVVVGIVWYHGVVGMNNGKKSGYGKSDFSVLYVAGSAAISQNTHSVQTLYDRTAFEAAVKPLRRGSGGSKYLYPLPSVFFFSPWAFIPFDVAWRMWLVLGISSFIAAYYCAIAFWVRDSVWKLRYTLALAAIAASSVFRGELYSGQVNSLLFLFVVAGVALIACRADWTKIVRNRVVADIVAGVLFGLTAIVKLFSLALIPSLIVRKQWMVLVAFATTLLVSVGVTLLVFTPAQLQKGITGVHDQPVQRGSVGFTRDSSTLYGSWRAGMHQQPSWLGIDISTEPQQKQLFGQTKMIVRVLAGVAALFIAFAYVRDRARWSRAPWVIDATIAFSFLLFFAESTHDQYHFFLLPFCVWLLSMPMRTTLFRRPLYWVLGAAGIFAGAALLFTKEIMPAPYWTLLTLKPATIAIGVVLCIALWMRFTKSGEQFWSTEK